LRCTCINDVIELSHKVVGKWTTVRIATELIPPLEDLIKNARDEFGTQLFRSKSDAVTEAVKEFLRKYSEEQGLELKTGSDVVAQPTG